MRNLLFLLLITAVKISLAQDVLIAFNEGPSGLFGYCDVNGEVKIPAAYTQAHIFCSEGFAFVYDGRKRKFTLIDVNGTEVSLPYDSYVPTSKLNLYDNNLAFIDGQATLNIRKDDAVVGLNGTIIFANEYSRIAPFKNGVAHAVKDKEDYLLHSDGKAYKINTKIRNIKISESAVAMNLIPFYGDDKKWGYVNTKGEVVIASKFDKVGEFSEDSIAWAVVTIDDVGYINTKGEWILDPIYDYASNFDPVAGVGFVRTKREEYLLVNRAGELISLPAEVEKVYAFSEGFGRVRINGNFGELGFINAKGEYEIEPIYKTLKYFENGIALAYDGKNWGGINTSGKTVIPFEFASIEPLTGGWYIVGKDNNFGFYDANTHMIIEPVYVEVKAFKDGYAAVRDAKTLKWGLVNSAGELMFEPKFHDLFFATRIE